MSYEHVSGNTYRAKVYDAEGMHSRYYYCVKTKCYNCGKATYVNKSNYDGNLYAMRFCSQECKSEVFRSKEHPLRKLRKNKRGSNGGHILAFAPDHPNARKGYVAEHRLVVEKRIRRYLRPDEYVHHIDCNQQNNASQNLVVLSCHEHRMAHASLLPCVQQLLRSGYLTYNRKINKYEVSQCLL